MHIRISTALKNSLQSLKQMEKIAAKYPVIGFTSKTISKTATGFEAAGTHDLHGVQKEITLP